MNLAIIGCGRIAHAHATGSEAELDVLPAHLAVFEHQAAVATGADDQWAWRQRRFSAGVRTAHHPADCCARTRGEQVGGADAGMEQGIAVHGSLS